MTSAGEFTWWNIVPALVGGLMSSASGVGMFWLAQKTERKKREDEKRRSHAVAAYAGLQKLTKTLNFIENIARHFDDQYAEAHENGAANQQPALIIRPLIGAMTVVEDLTAGETWFLTKGDGELMSRVWEIQERARTHAAVCQQYTKYRMEHDAFIESRADGITKVDGPIVSIELTGADARVLELRLGRLNQLIVPLIAALDEDRKSIVVVINDYIKAARGEFHDDFPAKSLELIPRKGWSR